MQTNQSMVGLQECEVAYAVPTLSAFLAYLKAQQYTVAARSWCDMQKLGAQPGAYLLLGRTQG
jgi:hypothetical protein